MAEKESFSDKIYKDIDFSGKNFNSEKIENCQFIRCILNGADFSYANMKNTKFISCDMKNYHPDVELKKPFDIIYFLKDTTLVLFSLLIAFPLVFIMMAYFLYYIVYFPFIDPYFGELSNRSIIIFGIICCFILTLSAIIFWTYRVFYFFLKANFKDIGFFEKIKTSFDYLEIYSNNQKTTAVNFNNSIFEEVYFENIYFVAPIFSFSKGIETCTFNKCENMFSANIRKTSLDNKNFSDAEIMKRWNSGTINFSEKELNILNRSDFTGFNLYFFFKKDRGFFEKKDLRNFIFRNSYIKNISFKEANIAGVDFRNSYIENVNFTKIYGGVHNCKLSIVYVFYSISILCGLTTAYGMAFKEIDGSNFLYIFVFTGYILYYAGISIFFIEAFMLFYFYIKNKDIWLDSYVKRSFIFNMNSSDKEKSKEDSNILIIYPVTTNYSNSILINVNFFDAKVSNIIFKSLYVYKLNLSHAKEIDQGIFSKKSILNNRVICDILSNDFKDSDLSGLDFNGLVFNKINFSEKNMSKISFSGGFFENCNFFNSNLSYSDLTKVEFIDCNLTGIQIKSWNIDSRTKFINSTCDYIYLDDGLKIPHSGNFKEGDFEKYIRKFIANLELFFSDGISWLAFVESFGEIQKNTNTNLEVLSIESKHDGAYLIKTKALSSDEINKEFLLENFMNIYEEKLSKLFELNLKKSNNTIIDLMKELAMNERKIIINGSVGVVGDNSKITTMNINNSIDIEAKILEIRSILKEEGGIDSDTENALDDFEKSVKEDSDVIEKYNSLLSVIKSSSDTVVSTSKAIPVITELARYIGSLA